MTERRILKNRNLSNSVIWLTIALIFCGLRLATQPAIFNIDEVIAPGVVNGMLERGDLNGNWVYAKDLPSYFQTNQFNFYSYNLFAVLFYASDVVDFVQNLRYANFVMQFMTLGMLIFYFDRLNLKSLNKNIIAALFTLSPAMVFDTHIARSESFLIFIFVALILTTKLQISVLHRFILYGIFLGIGISSKITFVLTAVVLIPEVFSLIKSDRKMAVRCFIIGAISLLVGFTLTAPYVVLEFGNFLRGVQALFTQYGSSHPPHSYLHGSIAKSLFRSGHFLIFTTGLLLPLAIYYLCRLRFLGIEFAIFGLIIIVYFALKPVFFERNIAIGILAILIYVAMNTRQKIEKICVALSAALMFYWSVNIEDSFTNQGGKIHSFEMDNFKADIVKHWPVENLNESLAACQGVFGLVDYNDDYSEEMLRNSNFVPIATFVSRYAILPTSTLHTYLEPSVHYFLCSK